MNSSYNPKNLIVNYLPNSLNQDDVKQMFELIGAVKVCKLIRNYDNGQSMGFAFVEFENDDHADIAIQKLNQKVVEDKTIKVSYARKPAEHAAQKDTNVYVAGLPTYVDDEKFKELFSPFGEITNSRVMHKDGHKGIGFVRFAKKSEAELAIESMFGKRLEGADTPLVVKLAIPPAQKKVNQVLKMNSELAVGTALSNRMGGNTVRYNPMAATPQIAPNGTSVLQEAAALQSAYSIVPTNTATQLAAHTALTQPQVQTSPLPPPGSGHQYITTGQAYTIYVYGIPPTSTDATLYELFSPFGAVLNVKVIRDNTRPDQPCKGFGFVNFKNYEEAYRAVIAMNGFIYVDGKQLQVSFKTAKDTLGQVAQVNPVAQVAQVAQVSQVGLLSQQQNPYYQQTY